MCLTFAINILVAMGTVTWRIPQLGPQIAAKTGNPAGLLFRRIWYSVGKYGGLGITEYRQGRPLHYITMEHFCIANHMVLRHTKSVCEASIVYILLHLTRFSWNMARVTSL